MKTWSLLLFAWLFAACASNPPVEEAPTKPNFLLIVADDLGYEKLGCYGGMEVSTPYLDAMAERGVLFERAYTSPVCTPSRMSLYTSLYAPRHGYTDVLPVHLGTREFVDFSQLPTYAQQFQQAGYHNAVTGKWQLAALEYHPDHVRSAGYDSWCVWQIWKDSAKTGRHYQATYNQDGKVREDIADRFGPDVMTEYVIGEMTKAQAAGQPFCIQHNMVLPHWPIVATPEDQRQGREPSLDHMIGYLDGIVGQLVAAVDSLGLADNTYIFFVGDNGTDVKTDRMTSRGPVSGGKFILNDGGMHVPLLALTPEGAGNRRDSSLIDMADFFPTLCELADVPLPAGSKLDGQSFVAPLLGKGPGTREFVTGAIKGQAAVFDGEWRLHQDGRVYDCRQLPVEREVTGAEAEAVRKRLGPLMADW